MARWDSFALLVIVGTIGFGATSGGAVCYNGGIAYNSTFCNCSGTCFNGDLCASTHTSCGAVPTVANSGSWLWEEAGSCEGKIIYTCTQGYRAGPNNATVEADNTINITCAGSVWTNSTQTCTRVQCSAPPLGRNVKLLEPQDRKLYFYGDVVNFRCASFTSGQDGHIQRTCQSDSTWSGRPLACHVTITTAIVIGLLVALLTLVLAIILSMDFCQHIRKVKRLKEKRTHTHRIKQASMMASPIRMRYEDMITWPLISQYGSTEANGISAVTAGVHQKLRRASGNEPSIFLPATVKKQFYQRLAEADQSRISEVSDSGSASSGGGEEEEEAGGIVSYRKSGGVRELTGNAAVDVVHAEGTEIEVRYQDATGSNKLRLAPLPAAKHAHPRPHDDHELL